MIFAVFGTVERRSGLGRIFPLVSSRSNPDCWLMDKISKRTFLKGAPVLGITAGGPILAGAATHSEKPLSKQEALLDPHYHSDSGWQFGSQAIHHGEQEGYQVTPISQDKCAPGYQRPGNLKNPTVAALLRKVMEIEGTQASVGGPCGMGIIAQTYMALLRPGGSRRGASMQL